jgi:hypothetical protein
VARSPGPAGGGRAERDRVRDEAAEAEAEEIGRGDPQMVEQRDDVTGQRLDRHGAAGVGGVPVALEFRRDHLPARREGSSNGRKLRPMVIRPPWSSTSGLPLPRIS